MLEGSLLILDVIAMLVLMRWSMKQEPSNISQPGTAARKRSSR
jgi:hypothetical protein